MLSKVPALDIFEWSVEFITLAVDSVPDMSRRRGVAMEKIPKQNLQGYTRNFNTPERRLTVQKLMFLCWLSRWIESLGSYFHT